MHVSYVLLKSLFYRNNWLFRRHAWVGCLKELSFTSMSANVLHHVDSTGLFCLRMGLIKVR